MERTTTGRKALGIVGGTLVAIVIVGLIEAIGHRLYPLPAGTDLSNPESLRTMIDVMPLAAKMMVLVAWFLGSLIGGWTAQRIARWHLAPWIVAAAIVIGGIWSMIMIPHPLWMIAAGVTLPLLAAAMVSRRTQAD
jgi:hypothetical protein